jgi:uncharacterized protein YxjI
VPLHNERDEYDISGIELRDNSYTVVQGVIRNKYKALDDTGETVLRGKQELFKLKEKFPFVDGDDEEVFTVTASSIIDIAGDYILADAETDDPVVILDNDFSMLQDTWTIRDPETNEALAEITSRGAAVTLARNLLPFGEVIPHKYEITDPQDAHVGDIDGQFTLLKDTYEVTIDDASSVPKEPVVAAAMVIDAIQGN